LALAEILEQNGLSAAGITPDGLARLRKRMIGSGHVERLRLAALKPERAPVLAGGLAIMTAAMAELGVHRINPVGGALRLGVLYDLLGRQVRRDIRVATIDQFATRYRIDREHAVRVAAMAAALHARASPAADAAAAQRLGWAALLHEIGFSVSHIGFHRHGAYILGNADMPGFSAGEQLDLALLVLGCRGGLDKMAGKLADPKFRARLLALRLAVIFHHARRPIDAPRVGLKVGARIRLAVSARWLKAHPLTAHLLAKERDEWSALGYAFGLA
jgi:exopolyphosphatase/guanosine-5'-triphosphate,3'-diphosphate pyrophosphatase